MDRRRRHCVQPGRGYRGEDRASGGGGEAPHAALGELPLAAVLDFPALLDRAASDPDFFQRLLADPLGACREIGYDLSADNLKELLGLTGVGDEQLGHELVTRLRSE